MFPLSVYQSVFHSSPVGECLLSLDAVILDVNDAFLKVALRQREDLVGKRLFDVFPVNPDDPEDTGVAALRRSLARVVETGMPDTLAVQRYPIPMALPDGSRRFEERYWSAVNTPIFDRDRQLLCISHSTMDVTEMVMARREVAQLGHPNAEHAIMEARVFTRAQTIQEVNKALQAERNRLRHLFEHAPGFVFFTRGPDHVLEQANDAFFDLVGQREVLGKTLRHGFPEVEGQGLFERLDEVYQTGKPFLGHALGIVLQRSPAEGLVKRYVDLVYQPILNAQGQVTGICGQGNDITDKRRIEKELRRLAARQAFQLELTDRLRPLSQPDEIVASASHMLGQHMDAARVMYCEVDEASGTFCVRRDWSCAGLASLAEEVKRLGDLGEAVVAALGRAEAVVIEDASTDPRTAALAKTYAKLGGSACLLIPLVKSERLTALLGVVHADPHGWTESDLQLTEDVAERTWSAVQTARAQDELREANVRKDEFLAMLAHELRNPLAPISAAAELMKMVRLSEVLVRQTSDLITRQVRHMTGLVDDLLDVSRVTRGLVAIRKSPQSLNDVVANAIEQVRPLIEAQGHDLEVTLPESSPQVLGDQKRLVQILTNLLNNAAKYTPPGGKICLAVEEIEERVLLHVEDNGIGISPELQSRVFDLFSQAERSADRSQGGLGLGLALVKSLVEHHGGTVTCHSEGLGKGSRFTVCLPRLEPPQLSADDGEPDEAVASLPAEKLRILVVDDNTDAAETLAMLLEASGHEVMVEFGAMQALERAREEKPDVCLLDIGLPEIDGNELARRLRSQPETTNTHLIAITGYGQDKDRKTSLAAGFDHHLVKPVDTGKLNSLLSKFSHA